MNEYRIEIKPYRLIFHQPAGTSRGVYTTRDVYYLHLSSSLYPERIGIGECAPLPDLSCDVTPDYLEVLQRICLEIEQTGAFPSEETLRPYPSIRFALETAKRHLECGSWALWDTDFSRGLSGIPINGLIWMGDHSTMLRRIEEKIEQGFRCIKMKIGAIDFNEELSLIKHIRQHFSSAEIELRVDANGAFSPEIALDRLARLAELDLHSIEQPIRAGQWNEMARLAELSPLPIALDEELIGCNSHEEKISLLRHIKPQYIILKPSLHGGFSGGDEWIDIAEQQGIGWWITSALESNIGLNAIAQWCASHTISLPQGLGTGMLFTNNIEMPLSIRRDMLWYIP
ncbi:MAG: o-succinylbenzoate synthase [Porphyromonadaceae bacterium]|nr:o-succinylbenzoate synthase [Porphyromonadaceae bacterium]